jgi:hypothetical protein
VLSRGNISSGRAADDLRADHALILASYLGESTDLMAAAELWRTLSTADLSGLLGVMHAHASPGTVGYLDQSITHVDRLDLDRYLAAPSRRHAIALAWSRFTAQTHSILGPSPPSRFRGCPSTWTDPTRNAQDVQIIAGRYGA